MIRTSLINGVINLDSDFSKYIESLSKPGVIEGLNVQDGVVKPGKARVKAERTNGETIYCYVENTEDVSLSGNDGKVYIVIDQEDIDSGLVSEDGSNIARIEEGNDRPTKNFLKLWSKTGAIIKDERDIIKKIDEVNEDIEDEISGIDTRLTEAEHDIQQIIEQSGSALSYLDTTCYAGEEIHENDLIVTNGNSFNPDRTDESTDVGGQTVNKYAIGFIGNGESTDSFSIKTSVIEGYEPDSVTINIETDDNGKPSGTVLATSDSLNAFKSYTDFSSFINYKTTSKTGDYYLARSQVKKDLSNFNDCFFSQNSSGYFLSLWNGKYFSFTFSRSGEQYGERNHLKRWSKDNKHFLFVRNSNKFQIGFTKITDFNDSTSGSVVSEINDTPTGSLNFTNYAFGLSEDGKTLYFCRPTGSSAEQTIGVIHTNTPRDFTGKLFSDATYYSMGTLFLQQSNPVRPFFEQEYNGKRYLFTTFRTANNSNEKLFGFVLDENNDITSFEVFDGNGVTNPCVKNHQLYWQKGNNIGVANLEWDYDYKTSKTIQLDTTVKTTKGTKYRLTIAPVVTGSVVDSVKIYDKEGEYYSECAVRDLNSWDNVAGKTPYIDSNCIKARYALKSNLTDSIDKIPYGFANGDFTEFESVHYCFKGIKKGFQGLETNTVYYSDDDGKITTVIGPCKVGKTTSSTDLMIDLDYSKSFSKSYSGKFTDSFKVPYDGYIKYSFSVQYTTYSFVVGGTNVINTKGANQGSTATTVSLAYTFVPAGTTITLSTSDNNGTAVVSGTVNFLSAREN